MLSIKELRQVHPGYDEYVYRWDYYARSYMGAEEYRDGAYLRKYIGEDDGPGHQYAQRLMDTPYQNHCKTTVDTYRSFIFRNPPQRQLDSLIENQFATSFVLDADLQGTNLTQFMRKVSDQVSIYGNAWVCVDRPSYLAASAAEEAAMDLRSYVALYSPTSVLDWSYEQLPNGRRRLEYVKVIEQQLDEHDIIKCWYTDRVEVYHVKKDSVKRVTNNLSVGNRNYQRDGLVSDYSEVISSEEYVNPIGEVPFVTVIDDQSFHAGIGVSDIGDVADLSRSIYNKLSELYANIRISSHPSIVAEPSTQLNGGVGSVITVDENTQISPYLLQPTGASIDGIIDAINLDIEAINEITHLKAVKAKSGSPMSAIAMTTERQNLNNKLSDRAATLERAEQLIWRLWFMWQDVDAPADFSIYYEKSFDLRDKHQDLQLYANAISLVPHDAFVHKIHRDIASMLIEDEDDLQEVLSAIADDHAAGNLTVPGEDQ